MTFLFHYLLFSCLYFIILILFHKPKKSNFRLLHIMMLVYILIVLTITVIPLPNIFNERNELFLQSVNLLPFRDIVYGYGFAKSEALFNVIMMIPFGILFPLLTRKKLLGTVLCTFLFSLTIESLQLLTVLFNRIDARTFDVTDLITNTTGGFIGYILFRIFTKKKNT